MLAARNGWTVLEPPVLDPDVKGWDPLRPGIQELLTRLEREKADIVIVYAMSRFARDYILQETVWRQLRERGARLVSVHEPHAEDDLVRGILGVVSQAERRRMGAFLSSSFRERARRGLPHGKVPFGFRKRADGRLEQHPDNAPWVLEIVDRLESGWSLWKCAIWLNDEHVDGRKWEPNVVRNTVRTPAIAGAVKCADVVTWEAHESIIDRSRYERLLHTLDTRTIVRRKVERSWLEGLMICGCGYPMHMITDRANYNPPKRQFRCGVGPTHPEFQRKRGVPVCTFTPRSIMVHAAVDGAIANLQDDLDRLIDWKQAHKTARLAFASLEGSGAVERKRLETTIAKVQNERERLLVLYRRGSLDVDRWETSDQDAASRLAALTVELMRLPEPPDPERLKSNHSRLLEMRELVATIAPLSPDGIRKILVAADARVQRTATGVRIAWPPDLEVFFEHPKLDD